MKTFTIFCQQAGSMGTIHIDSVEAADLDSAIEAGRKQCLEDWNAGSEEDEPLYAWDDIHCLGVIAGKVTVLHWEDQQD